MYVCVYVWISLGYRFSLSLRSALLALRHFVSCPINRAHQCGMWELLYDIAGPGVEDAAAAAAAVVVVVVVVVVVSSGSSSSK